ncbi:MAG: BamA/TamA family outer membrane protein [Bacteroidota bacterium]
MNHFSANILKLQWPSSIKSAGRKIFILLCFSFPLFFSCNTTQFLQPEKGETLLIANKIKFDKNSNNKIKGKGNLVEQLGQRFQQKPNRKLFGIRRPYFYYISLDSVNKAKIGLASDRTMRKILGEKPVFVDTAKAAKTAELMTTYMQNKGYFHAKVDYELTTNADSTKGTITYLIKSEGNYTIDTLMYESKDTAILRKLLDISDNSFLKPGDPIDIDLYEKEVSRITNYFVNNGYANFYPQYINSLEAIDSSNTDLNARLILEILVPPTKDFHQLYHIGDIYVYPEVIADFNNRPPPDSILNGVIFSASSDEFGVKLKSLARTIALKKGDLYRYENLESTRRQIGALGVFTTPTIKIDVNESTPGIMDFHIQLTKNKKLEIQQSIDVSYTERSNGPGLSANLIGVSYSPSFQNRNLFRGAELLVTSLDVGLEFAPLNIDSFLNSRDFRVQTDLYFPRFVEFPKVWNTASKLLGNDKLYSKLKRDGISRVSLSYEWLTLIDNYDLHFSNLSFGHEVKLSPKKRFKANQAGIDLLIPNIIPGSEFANLIDSFPSLERSFSRQFMSGFLFRDINFIYDESFLGKDDYWYFSSYFDLSGLETMGANWLSNQLSNADTNKVWRVSGVEFSHYAKLELDLRRYWKFGANRTLVARFNTGAARPFYNSPEVPYVKQFFVGAPNSIRGWYSRGLGPGSFRESLTDSNRNRNRFYQAGDIKIEMNLEYRQLITRPFNLFNLHGAIFLDAGNIWTWDYDDLRKGSQFSFKTEFDKNGVLIRNNFINAMAIAGGVGLRWDISYFTFRTDFGTPLRFPYPDENRNNSYWADFDGWGIRDIVLSLGLGYPF